MTDHQIDTICNTVSFICFLIGTVIALYICERNKSE
jgi:hypothetical protein